MGDAKLEGEGDGGGGGGWWWFGTTEAPVTVKWARACVFKKRGEGGGERRERERERERERSSTVCGERERDTWLGRSLIIIHDQQPIHLPIHPPPPSPPPNSQPTTTTTLHLLACSVLACLLTHSQTNSPARRSLALLNDSLTHRYDRHAPTHSLTHSLTHRPRAHSHRLVGLVVKASASRAEDPGFESRWRRDFFRVESYQ